MAARRSLGRSFAVLPRLFPSVHPAFQRANLLKSQLLQNHDRVQASHAGSAVSDDVIALGQLAGAGLELPERNQGASFETRLLVFLGLADVEELRRSGGLELVAKLFYRDDPGRVAHAIAPLTREGDRTERARAT